MFPSNIKRMISYWKKKTLQATIIFIISITMPSTNASDGINNNPSGNDEPIVSDLGCDLDLDGSAIRCKHSALDHIARAVSMLVPTVIATTINASAPVVGNIGPQKNDIIEVDIAECDVQTLPNLFARFNASLERIRIAHSQLQFVAVNAFTGLENRLRYLDLSGNMLRKVPSAVHLLVALEVLDLRDNHIQSVGDSTGAIPFRNAKSLRELLLAVNVLGMEDVLGGSVSGPGLSPLPTKQVHRLALDETVFNLGPAVNTLEFLDLSDNGLSAIPEQLQISLPRLRTLYTGNNKISDVSSAVFSAMPNLQSLILDSNLIRTLKFSSLPSNLKLFSLQDNPLQCDCGIMWLLDLVRRNSSLTLQLPPCNTPFYLRDITISHLNDDRLCHHGLDSDSEVHSVYVTDRDLASFHLGLFQALHLLDVAAEVGSLFVEWKVDPEFYAANLNWSIIFRRQDGGIYNFNTTQFTLENYRRQQLNWEPGEGIYSDSIRNISSPAVYVVCMAAVDNSVYYVHLNHCKSATTLRENPLKGPIIPTPIETTALTPSEDNRMHACNKTIPIPDQKIVYTFNGKVSTRTINLTWTVNTPAEEIRSIASLTDPYEPRLQSPLALDTLFRRREYRWQLNVRPFASNKQTETAVIQPEEDDNFQQTYVLTELSPDTGYIVCFSLESLPGMSYHKKENKELMEKVAERKCLEFITEKEYVFPVATVATAIVIATTLTAVIMSLVCCCLPRRYFKGDRLGAPIMDEDEESEKEGIINPGFLRSHLNSRPIGLQPAVRGNDAMRPRGSLGQLPPAVVRVMEQKRQQLEQQQLNKAEDLVTEENEILEDGEKTNSSNHGSNTHLANELVIRMDGETFKTEAIVINEANDVKYVKDAATLTHNHNENIPRNVPEEIVTDSNNDLKKDSVDCNDNTLSGEQWLTVPSTREQIKRQESI